MRYAPRQSVLASTLAIALAAGPAPARTSDGPTSGRESPGSACSLSIVPRQVTPGRPDARVLAETSERLAGTPTAEIPARSGIEVRDVEPDVSPDSWVLRLDLTDARPGTWRVTLEGRSVECTGEIGIRGSAADQSSVMNRLLSDSSSVGWARTASRISL